MKKSILISVFIVLIIFSGCTNTGKPQFRKINADEAKEMLDKNSNVVLIDVRTEDEYKSGHIPGSVLVPLNLIEKEIHEVVSDKTTPIIIYCRTGNRTVDASKLLEELGYTQVYDLGGIVNWPYETVK